MTTTLDFTDSGTMVFSFYVVLVWVDPIITADHGELAKNHASMAAVAFKFVIHGASPHGSQGTFT